MNYFTTVYETTLQSIGTYQYDQYYKNNVLNKQLMILMNEFRRLRNAVFIITVHGRTTNWNNCFNRALSIKCASYQAFIIANDNLIYNTYISLTYYTVLKIYNNSLFNTRLREHLYSSYRSFFLNNFLYYIRVYTYTIMLRATKYSAGAAFRFWNIYFLFKWKYHYHLRTMKRLNVLLNTILYTWLKIVIYYNILF